jgi:competence protein ComFB
MGFKERYDFGNLVNEAERLVIAELERQLALPGHADACRCGECVLDMAAHALNNIRPLYRVSLLGALYAQAIERTDFAGELRSAVAKAVDRIKSNPAHDRKIHGSP